MIEIRVIEDVNRYKREVLYVDGDWEKVTLQRITHRLSDVDLCKSVESAKVYDRLIEIAEEYLTSVSDEFKRERKKAIRRYRRQITIDTYRALQRIFKTQLSTADHKRCLFIICKLYHRYSEGFPLLEPAKHPLHLLWS